MSRGERNDGAGMHSRCLQLLHEFRITRVFVRVQGDEGLLIFANPGRRVNSRSETSSADSFRGVRGLQNVQAHGVARGIVEHQREEIERQHVMETIGEIMEKRFQVVLLGNRFADRKQRFKLSSGAAQWRKIVQFPERFPEVRHKAENSTRFGEVTTTEKVRLGGRFRILAGPCEDDGVGYRGPNR